MPVALDVRGRQAQLSLKTDRVRVAKLLKLGKAKTAVKPLTMLDGGRGLRRGRSGRGASNQVYSKVGMFHPPPFIFILHNVRSA